MIEDLYENGTKCCYKQDWLKPLFITTTKKITLWSKNEFTGAWYNNNVSWFKKLLAGKLLIGDFYNS